MCIRDREAAVGRADRVLAAFVGNVLGHAVTAPLSDDGGDGEGGRGEENSGHNLQENRNVILR